MATDYQLLEAKIRKLRAELIDAQSDILALEKKNLELRERLQRELEYCEENHVDKPKEIPF